MGEYIGEDELKKYTFEMDLSLRAWEVYGVEDGEIVGGGFIKDKEAEGLQSLDKMIIPFRLLKEMAEQGILKRYVK